MIPIGSTNAGDTATIENINPIRQPRDLNVNVMALTVDQPSHAFWELHVKTGVDHFRILHK